MFLEKKQKFLFKCDTCNIILTMEFDSPKEINDVHEDKILLECPCKGMCFPLRS